MGFRETRARYPFRSFFAVFCPPLAEVARCSERDGGGCISSSLTAKKGAPLLSLIQQPPFTQCFVVLNEGTRSEEMEQSGIHEFRFNKKLNHE